jgi:hypothetical protein
MFWGIIHVCLLWYCKFWHDEYSSKIIHVIVKEITFLHSLDHQSLRLDRTSVCTRSAMFFVKTTDVCVQYMGRPLFIGHRVWKYEVDVYNSSDLSTVGSFWHFLKGYKCNLLRKSCGTDTVHQIKSSLIFFCRYIFFYYYLDSHGMISIRNICVTNVQGYRRNSSLVVSSFMTYYRVCNKDATCGAGTEFLCNVW